MADKTDKIGWRMGFDSLDLPSAVAHKKNLDPPGFDSSAKDLPSVPPPSQRPKDSQMLQRKQNALYARATAPAKNIAFMCFMAWMMGSGIQMFSIIMTFSLLATPLSAIASSGSVFPKEEDWPNLDTLTPRALYCVVHFGQIVFGMYKLNGMGLLPVFPSDWISTMAVPVTLEHAYPAVGNIA
eukprot:gene26985-9000_t